MHEATGRIPPARGGRQLPGGESVSVSCPVVDVHAGPDYIEALGYGEKMGGDRKCVDRAGLQVRVLEHPSHTKEGLPIGSPGGELLEVEPQVASHLYQSPQPLVEKKHKVT